MPRSNLNHHIDAPQPNYTFHGLRWDVAKGRTEAIDVQPQPALLQFQRVCNKGPNNYSCNQDEYVSMDPGCCAADCPNSNFMYCKDPNAPRFVEGTAGMMSVQIDHRMAVRESAAVGTRVRVGGATDVILLDPHHFVTAGFSAKQLYLFQFDLDTQEAVCLDVLNLTFKGEPATPDLIHFDGEDKLAISFLRPGGQGKFRVNTSEWKLAHVEDHLVFPRHADELGLYGKFGWKCHAANFFPGNRSIMVATASEKMLLRRTTGFRHIPTNTLVHQIPSFSRKFYPQDVFFESKMYVFIVYTTTRIFGMSELGVNAQNSLTSPISNVTKPCFKYKSAFSQPSIDSMVVLYSIDLDVRQHVALAAFPILGAHADSIVFKGGLVFVNDQQNDVLHVLRLHIDKQLMPSFSPLTVVTGFHMPHGVDVGHGMLTASNYGDNTVKIMRLPELIKIAMSSAAPLHDLIPGDTSLLESITPTRPPPKRKRK